MRRRIKWIRTRAICVYMERSKEGFERFFLVFELVLREEKSLLGGVGGLGWVKYGSCNLVARTNGDETTGVALMEWI